LSSKFLSYTINHACLKGLKMKLTFLGANRQVTGSRYCLEAAGSKIMIDCGMVQERAYLSRNWDPCPVPASEFDALLLTHIHIDHCGLTPKFVHEGFRGGIYATRPTAELAEIVLYDSAHIQMEDAAYKNKRHEKEGRRGKYPVVPLYTEADVDLTLPLFQPAAYRSPVKINDAFSVTFHDAGHILGSAVLEVLATEGDITRRLLFSGDLGQWDKPLLRDPTLFEEADYVVIESTYGDREHADAGDTETQLCDVINKTLSRGGFVVIPTFAIERAQELMYQIGRLVHADRIPDIQVYLDSPMAVDVTSIFRKHRECFDDETWKLIEANEPPFRFPGLRLVRKVQESKAINTLQVPSVIMATSGMCTAGRIKHHLKRHIGRAENTILFVGYQGRGTLGRRILEGEPEVRIHGKNRRVRARIDQLHGFSGHADRSALLRWLGNLNGPPRRVFVTHGEEESALALAQHIDQQMEWPAHVPVYVESVELG